MFTSLIKIGLIVIDYATQSQNAVDAELFGNEC